MSKNPLEAGARRHRAYETGKRHADAQLMAARREARAWREEAKWWKDEHAALHDEFCEFVLYVLTELKIK